jgi:hypothetical protein
MYFFTRTLVSYRGMSNKKIKFITISKAQPSRYPLKLDLFYLSVATIVILEGFLTKRDDAVLLDGTNQ